MRPITDYVPKPLVPICNVPIMEWQIKYLIKFGISDIVMCTGYKTGLIEDRLKAKNYGARVTVSVEKFPLGTGGAIKQAARHIGRDDDSFIVLNGDVITDIDLGRLVNVRNSIAAIPLRTNYGILNIDYTDRDVQLQDGVAVDGKYALDHTGDNDGDLVSGFREKNIIPGMWMNAGIYHLGREALDDLPENGNIEDTLFLDYARRGMLRTVRFGKDQKGTKDVLWQSVDSFKDLDACTDILKNRKDTL